MAEYRLSPAAEHDLEDIWIYTFQQWGPDQAQRYVDLPGASFAELADFPRRAPALITSGPAIAAATWNGT